MAIGHTFSGDHGPVAVMQNGRQIAGAVKGTVSGTGRVELDSIYNSGLPSVWVKSPKGKQDKLEGKNLFDSEKWYQTVRDAYPTVISKEQEDGRLWYKWLSSISDIYYRPTVFKPKTQYSFSWYGKVSPYPGVYSGWVIQYTDGSQTFVYVTEERKYTLISEPGKTIDFLKCPTGNRGYTYMTDCQLEESPTPTPYEPYCGGIPAPNPQYSIDPVFLEGASVVGRGRNILPQKAYDTPTPMFLPAGTNVCLFTDGRPSDGGNVQLKGKSGKNIWCAIDKGTTHGANTLLKEDAVSIRNVLNKTEGHMFAITKDFVYPPYTPYYDGGTAPLPILRALPDGSVRDEIDVVSGTVVRRIGEIILTGDERITKSDFVEALSQKEAYQISKITPRIDTTYKPFSNSLAGHSWEGYFYANTIASAVTDMFIAMTNGVQTTDEFIAMLKQKYTAGTPVTVWYALATPIIEHYPPSILRQHPGYTQLIQQVGFREAEIEAEYWKEMGE